MSVYLPVLQELVARHDVLALLLRNDSQLAPAFLREMCYLQLRAICELFAAGSIALHAKRIIGRRILKTYEAPKVISELERLNPHFFPKLLSFTRGDDGVTRIAPRDGAGALTKKELVKLWGIAGSFLHRSPYTKLFQSTEQASSHDFADISSWSRKTAMLLSEHVVELDEGLLLLAAAKDRDTGLPAVRILTLDPNNGTAHVSNWLAKAPAPPRS